MEHKEFIDLVAKRMDIDMQTLTGKSAEYSRGDKLSNFKRCALMTGDTPEKALLGMVIKHLQAFIEFIKDIDNGTVQPPDRWYEKTGDIRCYTYLADALMEERWKGKNNA